MMWLYVPLPQLKVYKKWEMNAAENNIQQHIYSFYQLKNGYMENKWYSIQ